MTMVMSWMKGLGTFILASVAVIGTAWAQLEPYTDFEMSEGLWEVSTIKVEPTQVDYYLAGLKRTWVASNEVAKELGHIEDYKIMSSDLPGSGSFNLLLMVKFKSTQDLAPSKERYDAFMAEWGRQRMEETRETAKSYPTIRKITGQYHMREITIK